MSPAVRLALVALLVVGSGAMFVYISTGENDNAVINDARGQGAAPFPPTNSRPMDLVDCAQCAECHQEIYDEWLGSHHAFSWLNPEPRRPELSNNFKNKDCIPCHAPRPMIEVGYGLRPLERETRRETGVDCFTCHKYKNVMAASNRLGRGAAAAPCNPVEWAPVAEIQLCAPCHDQHKVQQDWMLSRFGDHSSATFQDCNDCHMPAVAGPGTKGVSRKTHRSHAFPGGHDATILRTSATLRAAVVAPGASLKATVASLTGRDWVPPSELESSDARRVLIEVKNTGVGHNFPADERHRAVDLVARSGASGPAGVRLTRFRNPYRHEFEMLNPFEGRAGEVISSEVVWGGRTVSLAQVRLLPEYNPDRKVFYPKSTQLHAGESRLIVFTPPADEKIDLSLYYKLNPYLPDDEAVETNTLAVELP